MFPGKQTLQREGMIELHFLDARAQMTASLWVTWTKTDFNKSAKLAS